MTSVSRSSLPTSFVNMIANFSLLAVQEILPLGTVQTRLQCTVVVCCSNSRSFFFFNFIHLVVMFVCTPVYTLHRNLHKVWQCVGCSIYRTLPYTKPRNDGDLPFMIILYDTGQFLLQTREFWN